MEQTSLSLFKGYSDKSPSTATLAEVINLIRESPAVRDHTEKHRYFLSQGNAIAARREKSSCPCFAVAVRFDGGKQQKHIHSWTGLCLADIDHIDPDGLEELRRKACADPHTLLAYVTIGGNGLRILFLIDHLEGVNRQSLTLYKRIFEQANRYYADLLGCPCDLQCKNATRLSGLAHDPAVFFNPAAQPFRLESSAETQQQTLQPASRPAARRLLKRAVAAASQILQQEQVVYEPHHRNQYIMRMGYLLNAYGVPQADAEQWAVDTFTDYDGNVAGVIASCYTHVDEHATRPLPAVLKAKAKSTCDVKQIEDFLNRQAAFRHNVITGQCEIAYLDENAASEFAPLTDRDVNSLWTRMSKEVGRTRQCDIYSVLHSDFVPLYNPFRDYLQSLPAWDGTTDHIARLASTVHVRGEQARFTAYFRKWLVGLVAGVIEESNVNHQILVLIGSQGSYKTTWFNYLLPPELRRYFLTKVSNNYASKDDLFSLSEFILICLEEIDEMSPATLNQLKAMVTLKSVNERAAYARNKEHRPHIASFCATGNNVNFLNDPSGNRRWLPFEVESIDPPQDNPVDYVGVYAQAYRHWQDNFRYWFDAEEIDALNRYNQRFETPNLERELILSHFRCTLPGETGIFVTTAYVLNQINRYIRQPLSPIKVGLLMKQLGFKSIRYAGQRGYRVYEYTAEEIMQNRHAAARFTQEDWQNPEDGRAPEGGPDEEPLLV